MLPERPSAIATRLGFSRARVSQLLDLNLLAPDIVGRLLGWTTEAGRDPITERDLRAVLRHRGWSDQREVFDHLVTAPAR